MTFLPIVARELASASRRPRTVRARVAAVCWGFGFGAYVFVGTQRAPAAEVGRAMFWTFAAVLSLYCLMGGCVVTADCISSEKREGTLGFLFLTDLKGYDVVLGKLAACSLNVFYRLLGLAPLLAIPFLLGGVDPGMYGRVLLADFDVLLFSLTAGLLASALCAREKLAGALAAGLVFGLNLVLPVIEAGWAVHRGRDPAGRSLFLSPWYGCYLAIISGTPLGRGNPSVHLYWINLAVTHLYTWVFLLAACWITPRSWQERGGRAKEQGMAGWVRRLWAGSEAVRKAWRTKCLERNAYLWLAARQKRANLGFELCLALLFCSWWLGWWRFGDRDWLEPSVTVFSAIVLQLFFKLWVARIASERFVEDRRAGAFELLLSTPLSAARMVQGQWAALRAYFGRPLCFLILSELLLYAALHEYWRRVQPDPDRLGWNLLAAGNALVTGLDLWALAVVGMAGSLTASSAGEAARRAVAKILVLPSLLYVLVMMGLEVFASTSVPSGTSDWTLAVWVFLSVLVDLGFGGMAVRTLRTRFREFALQPFSSRERRSIWPRRGKAPDGA